MHTALVADTFPPLRSSGAVQLRDLSLEFVKQGHDVTVLVASPQQAEPWLIEYYQGVRLLRLRTPRTKDVGYARRTLAELFMPFFMRLNYNRSPLANTQFDAVLWYSPSIFFGPMVRFLSLKSRCPTYLIIRDIFPEWAVDMGLMGKGLPYLFFRAIANYQYSVANVIGVQTPGNRVYFENWLSKGKGKLDILQNWLSDLPASNCSIRISASPLAGRMIFVYAGNMGIAQGMDNIFEFVHAMQARTDVGFVFVGRGSDSQRLKAKAEQLALDNVLFFDEIDPDEIPGLYAQCHAGIVALDVRHKTHNIPGKFISYMQSGLPVFAVINPGNDLEQMISAHRVGVVLTHVEVAEFVAKAEILIDDLEEGGEMSNRCRQLYLQSFSPKSAVSQIVQALQK
ncbi:MAG: glycosyltransferase family 4 protein [Gammaproteobacteria bacterium]|nr:glycosyltransferase family 4 protein [Gammaproteobacteria bacterium]